MKEKKNWLEWMVFAISLILMTGLLGTLVYLAITFEETSPELKVTIKFEEKQADKYIHFVELKNDGGITAEDVQIEIIAWQKGKETEKAEIIFPFAPKFSTRSGWVSFKINPADVDSITSGVSGYLKL